MKRTGLPWPGQAVGFLVSHSWHQMCHRQGWWGGRPFIHPAPFPRPPALPILQVWKTRPPHPTRRPRASPRPGQPAPGAVTHRQSAGASVGEMIITRPREAANFDLQSDFSPAGDQPQAITELVEGIRNGERDQVLLGVTGSGKTFTAAHVIRQIRRPTLILAPNKTLAAQLYGEMKALFPDNAVEYFVSYYDYYQPEAYVPRSDTYIEKESSINEQIDRMRHSATRALLERDDVIIVASVSCIYGIGSVETYSTMTFRLSVGEEFERQSILRRLTELQYRRNDTNFVRGTFRVRGDNIELFPAHLEDRAWRISLFGDEIEDIFEIDPLTGEKTAKLPYVTVFANSHYVTPRPTLQQATKLIRTELKSGSPSSPSRASCWRRSGSSSERSSTSR